MTQQQTVAQHLAEIRCRHEQLRPAFSGDLLWLMEQLEAALAREQALRAALQAVLPVIPCNVFTDPGPGMKRCDPARCPRERVTAAIAALGKAVTP